MKVLNNCGKDIFLLSILQTHSNSYKTNQDLAANSHGFLAVFELFRFWDVQMYWLGVVWLCFGICAYDVMESSTELKFYSHVFALKLCSISFVIIAGWRLRLVTFVYWLISSLKAYTWVTSVKYFKTALMLFSSPMERSVQLATPTTGIQTSPNCRKLMINRHIT